MKAPILLIGVSFFLSCKDSSTTNTLDNFNDIPSSGKAISKNNLPVISNVNIEKSDTTYIITFDLIDDDESIDISLYGLDKSTDLFSNEQEHATGDVGDDIQPGVSKTIVWNPDQSFGQLQIIADDQYSPSLDDVLNLVSKDRIRNDLLKIEGIRNQNQGKELLEKTRSYLIEQFEQNNIDVTDHVFPWNGFTGHNIVGTLQGTNPFVGRYAVSGHYDTVSSTPGSDDNASGTVGMLEVMRILSLFRFNKTMDFIGFDLEEWGLRGARSYVQNYAKNQLFEGLINFEMIGYTCKTADCQGFTLADTSIYNIANPASSSLQNVFQNMGNMYVPELKIQRVIADSDPNFRRSDHAPFWDAGIQALFLTDGANFRNPHYHQPSDRIATLDLDFTIQIVKTTVATLIELSDLQHVGLHRSDL